MNATSYVGQQANPHPTGNDKYVVEVIDQDDGEVRVRYLSGLAPAWWITEDAWVGWRRLGAVEGTP